MSGNEKREPLIQVQNLGKSFGNIEVLKDITVDIYKGDVVFVVGPSGSGKSTFLRCLNRLEEPTKGHIYFEGTDITDPKTDIDKHRQKMVPAYGYHEKPDTGAYEASGQEPAGGRSRGYAPFRACRPC